MSTTKSAPHQAHQDDAQKLFSVRVQTSILDRLRAVSYWDRETISDTVNKALEEYLERYEKTNGAIKAAPAEHLEKLQKRAGGKRRQVVSKAGRIE